MSNLNQKIKLALLTDLFVRNDDLSKIFRYIGLSGQDKNLLKPKNVSTRAHEIFSLKYVPKFFETVLNKSEKYSIRNYQTVNGYAINLKNYEDLDSYLKANLNKRRKSISRAVGRLNSCFQISTRMYQSDISLEEYESLMLSLKCMIQKRFNQRGQQSDSLKVWDRVYNSSFELMRQKKASLFVIYQENEPIALSFNYNYLDCIFSYISSYDIDYAKFSPGQIEIHEQLKWCCENGYTRFEMGWGDLPYKAWWSNEIYKFRHQLIYPKGSISGFIYAAVQGNKSRLIAFLISKGINKKLKNIKTIVSPQKDKKEQKRLFAFENCDLEKINDLQEISQNTISSPITKELFNDFLFLSKEYYKDVSVYYSKFKDCYILKGKSVAKSVHFN